MPVIISPSLIGALAVTQPLTHARIGIQTFATVANLSVASTPGAAGFPLSALSNPLTFESWKSSLVAPAISSLIYDRGLSPETVDWNYFGIAGHNLGSTQCVVKLQSSSGGGPTTLLEFIPGTDDAIMALVPAQTNRLGAIVLEPKAGALAPIISIVYIGKALAMQRGIYGGHSPFALSRRTAVRPNLSETGQFIGRSIERKGKAGDLAWKHLTPEWYREEFDPFVKLARARGWFLAWRPSSYPDEVEYCWTNADIKPVNMGIAGLMEVGFSAEALDVAAS